MAVLYTGQAGGISKIATGTPSALCRKASNFNVTANMNIIENKGVGGQLQVIEGFETYTVSWTCVGMTAADMAKWFPTTAGTQVASFPDLLLELDDGTNGAEWTFSNGQPSSMTISHGGGEDAQVEINCECLFPYYTKAAIGTDVPVYNSLLGYSGGDITVQVDAVDMDVLSFDISVDLATQSNPVLNTRSLGQKRRTDGIYITDIDYTVSVTTSSLYYFTASGPADSNSSVDLTFVFNNGTDTAMTITCDDFYLTESSVDVSATDIASMTHTLKPASGTMYNRITFS